MSDEFKIGVKKACPACDISCPNFEIDSATVYNGIIGIRKYFCKNEVLCNKLWRYLKKHNGTLEGH